MTPDSVLFEATKEWEDGFLDRVGPFTYRDIVSMFSAPRQEIAMVQPSHAKRPSNAEGTCRQSTYDSVALHISTFTSRARNPVAALSWR